MNYEPTNWKDGDLITASKLNNLDKGIVATEGAEPSSVMVIYPNNDGDARLTATYQQIKTALLAGKVVFYINDQPSGDMIHRGLEYVSQLYENGYYQVTTTQLSGSTGQGHIWRANTVNDYPEYWG